MILKAALEFYGRKTVLLVIHHCSFCASYALNFAHLSSEQIFKMARTWSKLG